MKSQIFKNILESTPDTTKDKVRNHADGIVYLREKFSPLTEPKRILSNHLAYMAQQGGLGAEKVKEILENGISGIHSEDEEFFVRKIDEFNPNSDYNKSLPDSV